MFFRFLDIFRQKLGLLEVVDSDEKLIHSLLWVRITTDEFLKCSLLSVVAELRSYKRSDNF